MTSPIALGLNHCSLCTHGAKDAQIVVDYDFF